MTVSDPTPDPVPSPKEDRRRPKALLPYLALWGCLALCVIFAVLAAYSPR